MYSMYISGVVSNLSFTYIYIYICDDNPCLLGEMCEVVSVMSGMLDGRMAYHSSSDPN